MHSITDQDFT
jgi:hypothetical protein